MNQVQIFVQQSGMACVFEVSGLSEGAEHSFQWEFGDGNSSDLPKPTHIYAQAGSYQVAVSLEEALPDGSKQQQQLKKTLEVKGQENPGDTETDDRDVGGVHVKKKRAKN
ncbi:MAG: PKD domain-containing protein [Bacteroidetes bacterium]|nr:MAG: PKD domain-containing protein [Bacteroidota bacterium]